VKTGVQSIFNTLKTLDSGFRRDFNAADNFTLGAGIVRYGSARSEHVQDLILFLAKLNMAETCDSLFLKRLVLVV
jgi:hypothetical protein